MENPYKIGITQGDINGISYEVIMKALSDNKIMELCTPTVYGLSKVASFYRKMLNMNEFSFQFVKDVHNLSVKKPNLINLNENEIKIEVGESTAIAGKMAELSIEAACDDLKKNLIDAVVTAPINKYNIQSESFNFNGHTEYFSHTFKSQRTMMMMISDKLKIGFVTNHVAVQDLPSVLSENLVLEKIQVLHDALIKDFACTNPKIAVLSLNPHAGDSGLIGSEENEIIKPAIADAFNQKINAFGPFASDGFFASGQYMQFDAILAMYHDQGMIPFKLLAMEDGVNYTAGLPIVRTSPAHGTAYHIAGKNIASAQSMRSAIFLAIDILNNRAFYNEKL
ncbi:MAG: 4-hydroxythreonine-4-phosphate dehydrogenase [Bacteroidetes bacterium]|nr:4-hydroxythreonine-4-phosphate dehydrogenase [Bacteroidota bacterium]